MHVYTSKITYEQFSESLIKQSEVNEISSMNLACHLTGIAGIAAIKREVGGGGGGGGIGKHKELKGMTYSV